MDFVDCRLACWSAKYSKGGRTMYIPSNPTCRAMRAEYPSYTPGHMRKVSGSSTIRRNLVAAEIGADA
jgi:hypothetical protein